MPIYTGSSSQSALWNVAVHQYERADVRNKWVNTFTISTDDEELDSDKALLICSMIGNAFLTKMNANVVLDRVRLFTYAPKDTVPYDANEFIVRPFNNSGLVVRAQPMLPVNVAVIIDKVVASGRNGRLMVRGLLNSADVYEGLGGYILTETGKNTTNEFASTLLAGLQNLGAGILYVVPSVNKDQSALTLPDSRYVLDHTVKGVTVTRHRGR